LVNPVWINLVWVELEFGVGDDVMLGGVLARVVLA
jgi:hypothetical protein